MQHLLRPLDGGRIGALAGQKQCAEFRQVVLLEQLAVRVFLADGAERGRRGEQRHRLVLRDHAPEGAGVGRAHRLALIHDRRGAVKQRRIDDVGMADHPADIGCAPPDLAGVDAIEILHRPFQRDHVAAIVAQHALGNAGRARGVEDVERIGSEHGHAFAGLGVVDRVLPHRAPIVVAAGGELRLALRALQDQAGGRLVLGEFDRLVEHRLIGDHARGLDAAARRQDQLGLAIVDAGGEFLGREATEHDRVDGADPRTSQHAEHRLRHHGHIEDDDVALLDAEVAQHGAEQLYLRQHPAIGKGLRLAGDRRIVDQRRLVVAPIGDMAVERVVAGVGDAAGKPAAIDAGGLVEDLLGLLVPVDRKRGLAPETLRVALPARVNVMIAACRRVHL